MKNSKKGLMVKFLTVLILTLLIFTAACGVTSKFFRLSDQAKNNYGKFTQAIKDIEGKRTNHIENHLMIIDEKTSIVYFEKNKDVMLVDVDGWSGRNYKVTYEKPSLQCTAGKNCLCLFRESSISGAYPDIKISPDRSVCLSDFKQELKMVQCGFGVAKDVVSYKCTNGWVIERNHIKTAKDKSYSFDAHYEAPRRISVTLKKEAKAIALILQ